MWKSCREGSTRLEVASATVRPASVLAWVEVRDHLKSAPKPKAIRSAVRWRHRDGLRGVRWLLPSSGRGSARPGRFHGRLAERAHRPGRRRQRTLEDRRGGRILGLLPPSRSHPRAGPRRDYCCTVRRIRRYRQMLLGTLLFPEPFLTIRRRWVPYPSFVIAAKVCCRAAGLWSPASSGLFLKSTLRQDQAAMD